MKRIISSSILAFSCILCHLNAQEIEASRIKSPTVLADGHSYVDLGLSVKWASCNVGAMSPAGNGNYYAWGEISTKSSYDQDNYSITFDLKAFSGDPRYDAASANWGGAWRMPKKAEVDELIKKCKYSQVPINDRVYAKFTGPNGNSIIFPISGTYIGTDLGGGPLCWIDEPAYGGFRNNAMGLNGEYNGRSIGKTPRDWGANVRAVFE